MTSFIVKNPFALALFWVMGPRESISYRTDRYGRYIPYWSLKPHRSPCVLFLFKYRSYWVVSAIPDEISCFGRKNHTGLEHDFQIKKKEKFSDPVSLSSFSNILTYSLSLCCYPPPESHRHIARIPFCQSSSPPTSSSSLNNPDPLSSVPSFCFVLVCLFSFFCFVLFVLCAWQLYPTLLLTSAVQPLVCYIRVQPLYSWVI